MKKVIKEDRKEVETPPEVWKKLDKEWNKIFDQFKYFNEPNKILFLNILIGEAVKSSQISALSCIGLLTQITNDISNYVRNNLSIPMEKKPTFSYVG